MHAMVAAGGDFAIAAPRSQTLWRAYAAIPEDRWVDARDMRGAQVAACDYAPAGAPAGTYTIVRRVKVRADEVSTDPRSRLRRTIPTGQLQLMLDGVADHGWAVSFLVTNIPADEPDGIVALEWWFRGRADVETRIKEHKLGAGLRHLPSADPTINRVWMWAAILAGWISALLQAITGYDQHTGRAHAPTLPIPGGLAPRQTHESRTTPGHHRTRPGQACHPSSAHSTSYV
ncbi:transposase [Frankia sp. CIT1]|uniref:transposase n=1 Tax=Frankia sp. CIT1 TaxID=2880974 RepID=UPI001EF52D09|nr:transposase [Frankia sp. CIT1]